MGRGVDRGSLRHELRAVIECLGQTGSHGVAWYPVGEIRGGGDVSHLRSGTDLDEGAAIADSGSSVAADSKKVNGVGGLSRILLPYEIMTMRVIAVYGINRQAGRCVEIDTVGGGGDG